VLASQHPVLNGLLKGQKLASYPSANDNVPLTISLIYIDMARFASNQADCCIALIAFDVNTNIPLPNLPVPFSSKAHRPFGD